MDLDPRVLCEPVADLDALVGGVVVHHQVQFGFGVGAGDLFEEREELLVPVPGFAGRGDLPGRDLQRREQGAGAVPDVVVGPPLRETRLHRQHRSGPVQRLDLGLLVDAQHNRVLRRGEVEPAHVGDLHVRQALRREQHDPRPLRQPRPDRGGPHPRVQLLGITVTQHQRIALHAPSSRTAPPKTNRTPIDKPCR